jgi:small subunit ribosomal protein S15
MANATIDAKKADVFKTYGGSAKNTGSVEAQVALLTEKIQHISSHIKNGNKKDHSSNRGLLKMVGQRKRLLKFLSDKDIEGYRTLIGKLGLRK